MNWMDRLRPHGAHCDITVRTNYSVILEPSKAYNEATQTVDVNVRQITQVMDVVGTKMYLSTVT